MLCGICNNNNTHLINKENKIDLFASVCRNTTHAISTQKNWLLKTVTNVFRTWIKYIYIYTCMYDSAQYLHIHVVCIVHEKNIREKEKIKVYKAVVRLVHSLNSPMNDRTMVWQRHQQHQQQPAIQSTYCRFIEWLVIFDACECVSVYCMWYKMKIYESPKMEEW